MRTQLLINFLALIGAAATTCLNSDEQYCARFSSDECDTFTLHARCALLCGVCTPAPTPAPTPEIQPGIFRKGSDIEIASARGGRVSINGRDVVSPGPVPPLPIPRRRAAGTR